MGKLWKAKSVYLYTPLYNVALFLTLIIIDSIFANI